MNQKTKTTLKLSALALSALLLQGCSSGVTSAVMKNPEILVKSGALQAHLFGDYLATKIRRNWDDKDFGKLNYNIFDYSVVYYAVIDKKQPNTQNFLSYLLVDTCNEVLSIAKSLNNHTKCHSAILEDDSGKIESSHRQKIQKNGLYVKIIKSSGYGVNTHGLYDHFDIEVIDTTTNNIIDKFTLPQIKSIDLVDYLSVMAVQSHQAQILADK